MFESLLYSDVNGDASFEFVREEPRCTADCRNVTTRTDWQPETITVTTSRLDDCIPRDSRPDFVKIDVEGGECGVLAERERGH